MPDTPETDQAPASTERDRRAVARGIVTRLDGERIVLQLAHTDYRLHLACAGPIDESVRRMRGIIETTALRVHPASGGGRFIEPAEGEPRIVAGTVLSIDESNGRVLIDAAVPMWLRTLPNQDFGVFVEGSLVNCYVKSGSTFRPLVDE